VCIERAVFVVVVVVVVVGDVTWFLHKVLENAATERDE